MFHPDQRLLLTEALRPPNGYVFDRAVATTFTLDLTAALVAPISLGAQRWGDRTDPITMMESVRAVTDRIDVFCQTGMVKVPSTATDLIAFLEPMVHEVRPPRSHDLFHPKIWLLRFVRPDAPTLLRLLCSSRNLTNDRSWDLLVTLDGEVGAGTDPRNQPLSDLVRSLPGLALRELPDERAAAINQLAEDALRATWERPADVKDMWFHTLGLPGQRPPDFRGSNHLIISAYVNDEGIRRIAGDRSSLTLISREDELARLDPSIAARAELYTLDPAVGLDEDGVIDDIELSGLHAKAVIVDRRRAFVGSMNATGQGVRGNVEFVVELETVRGRLSPTKLLDPDEPSSLIHILREYEQSTDEPPEPEDWSLEADLRAAAASDFELTVAPDGDRHQLLLRADPIPTFDDTTVEVAVHARPGDFVKLRPGSECVFQRLALADISPFVVLRLRRGGDEQQTIVRARLIGDPPGRLDAIIARQIDTPEKLLRFIMLVLQLAADGDSEIDLGNDGASAGGWFGTPGSAGIMEQIAVALADHPSALDDIDRLITRLRQTPEGEASIPPGLNELWDEVMTARSDLTL